MSEMQWDRAQLEKALRARGETRPVENIIAQYLYEREMAERLRQAPREERKSLYHTVYDNLFTLFPDHPELVRRDTVKRLAQIRSLCNKIKPFLTSESVFLEIGAGDCLLSYEVARVVKQVYALEVSASKLADPPPDIQNFKLILFDGFEFPFPDATFDVAFSYQVLEHLHPEDALEHLQQVYRLLKPGGCYICIVPHRFTGPHDISYYFTEEASALHLKEYTYYELMASFRKVGFGKMKGLVVRCWIPAFWLVMLEHLLEIFPYRLRKRLARGSRILTGVAIAGYKG